MIDISCFQHKTVRDLAWVICSAPMLSGKPFEGQALPTTADDWSLEACQDDLDWLIKLDRHPAELVRWVEQCRTQRLGIYFEYLVHFWLKERVARGFCNDHVRIMEGKKVLGELDFLFSPADGKCVHCEVAVKLYLYYQQDNGLVAWIGPNARDRLNIKLSRLANHQLKIAYHPLAQQLWRSLGCESLVSFVFLKGYLFYPSNMQWHVSGAVPDYINPQHARGWWTSIKNPLIPCIYSDSKWVVLPRLSWLSSLVIDEKENDKVECGDFMKGKTLLRYLHQHFSRSNRSILVAEMQFIQGCWKEKSRGFVVSEYWPEQQ